MSESNGNYKLTTEHRLTNLEGGQKQIMENHLPHLQRAIDKNSKITWWVLTTLILGLVTIISLLVGFIN